MKKVIMTILVAIVVVVSMSSSVEAQLVRRGSRRIITYRRPYSYHRYGYRNTGGVKYSDAKEGLEIRSDFLTTLITGSHKGVIAISREAREAPKLSLSEMEEIARRAKIKLQQKHEKAALEKENTELKKQLEELKKDLAGMKQMLQQLLAAQTAKK